MKDEIKNIIDNELDKVDSINEADINKYEEEHNRSIMIDRIRKYKKDVVINEDIEYKDLVSIYNKLFPNRK